MNKIKFSHDYEKKPLYTDNTTLLEVFTVADKKDLSKQFLLYDTKYKGEDGGYILPDGKLLILLLHSFNYDSCAWELWTTCRRWTAKKERYYRSLRGQTVLIEIIKEVK